MLRVLARLRTIALIAAASALAYAAPTETTLHPKIVDQPPFQVEGIAASTNNAKEAGPDAIIGKQWQRFLSGDLLDKIPNRVDQSIIAVYTDYTSDANGEYTVILGAKVKPGPNPTIPDGMVVPPPKLCRRCGGKSGATSSHRKMARVPINPTLRYTIGAPPIPTTRKWTSMLG
jgi:hypothetical protein